MEVEIQPHHQLPCIVGTITVSKVAISGRCLFGLLLDGRAPGITAVDFSFVEQPHVQVDVEPFGVAISQLPGVHMLLRVWLPHC